jgi:hypothetical protein
MRRPGGIVNIAHRHHHHWVRYSGRRIYNTGLYVLLYRRRKLPLNHPHILSRPSMQAGERQWLRPALDHYEVRGEVRYDYLGLLPISTYVCFIRSGYIGYQYIEGLRVECQYCRYRAQSFIYGR